MTLADLHEEYEARLWAYAAHLVHDHDSADDLVQEAFIRALGHLPLIEQLNGYQRQAWLYQTVKNLFLDRRAARLREQAAMARLSLETDAVVAPVEPGMMEALLAWVPESCREVLVMRFVRGMNSTEIASELGIPAPTVRSRLHVAIQRLRARRNRLL